MIINHNLSAMFSNRVLKFTNWDVNKNQEKLSSGERINRAGDDAANLAVSEKMRGQISGLRQAERNAEDGISFIQTTEGYLEETHAILQRMRVLAVQGANGIYTREDRMQIQVEISQLVAEIDRIAYDAQFNEMNMLTGSFADTRRPSTGTPTSSMWLHVGANENQRYRMYIGTMTSEALAVGGKRGSGQIMSYATPNDCNSALGILDAALKRVAKQRADLGAYQNRLEHTAKGLMVGFENLQAAESRIRDTDMAEEMVDYTKNQILTQTGTAMLSQANNRSQTVLQLLGR